MPAIALSRIARPGCSTGCERSCKSTSGEAFTSAQLVSLPPETTMEDWVRARARNAPRRRPAQLGQLQFHWGKPPPAAEPSTLIFTHRPSQRDEAWDPLTQVPYRAASSAIGDVHRDFHAKTEI